MEPTKVTTYKPACEHNFVEMPREGPGGVCIKCGMPYDQAGGPAEAKLAEQMRGRSQRK